MISQLKPPEVKILSLTTVATPHRGRETHILLTWSFFSNGVKVLHLPIICLNG